MTKKKNETAPSTKLGAGNTDEIKNNQPGDNQNTNQSADDAVNTDSSKQTPKRDTSPEGVSYPIMACIKCRSLNTKVVPNSGTKSGDDWRRRQCGDCGKVFKESLKKKD